MILKRTGPADADFLELVRDLDEYLAEMDGDEHSYYAQFNTVENIPYVVVAFSGREPVACGAFKPYSSTVAEIKRMYVKPEHRGRKIGQRILSELETWARELEYTDCILETGHRQTAAVNLYQNAGYAVIPNYGQYRGIDNSVCMKKEIGLSRAISG